MCFQDADNNNSFETVYLTPQNHGGATLPVFDRLVTPRAVDAPYSIDAVERVFFFEQAIRYESGRNIRGRTHTFTVIVRPGGATEWKPMVSNLRGTVGGLRWILVDDVPTNLAIMGMEFRVASQAAAGLEIEPIRANEGILALSIQ